MIADNSSSQFISQLADIRLLAPREINGGKKIAQATNTRKVVTIVGLKTTTARFLPVSHAGYSNETYVDKVDLLGKTRAEFIGRKLKGIERRAHMTLFRELAESHKKNEWRQFFETKFGKLCTIPDGLCISCWNCSLFGGLEAGKGATFSRIRYFDTFSVGDGVECIQSDDSPEQMAIGNTVGEDLSKERGEASFHRYEYVKAGTRFPFITIIESPTLLDVAGYIHTIRRADAHGYGKYSANNGKFETKLLAVSTGYPRFSVLDLLEWAGADDLENNFKNGDAKFDGLEKPVVITGEEIEQVAAKLGDAFTDYLAILG